MNTDNKNISFGTNNNDNNKSTLPGNSNNSNTEDNKGFSVGNSLNKSNNSLFNTQNNESNNKDNKNIFGVSLGNSDKKNDNNNDKDNKNEENKNKTSLFNFDNQNEIKIEEKGNLNINIANNGNKIDIKIGSSNGLFDNKSIKKEEASSNSSKQGKNYLFDLNSDLNKNLFKNNNDEENKTKKEEDKKEKEEKKEKQKNIKDKIKISIDTQNINEISFGTPKKEKPKLENSINFIQPQISTKPDDNIITNSLRISNNVNSLSSSRLEDNEQIQSALQNMYAFDILSKSLSENVKGKESKQNRIKKSRSINFKLSVEIEGVSIMNDKELNMTSLSDENMSNLMKKVRLILKKKFKMYQEIEDFDIYLIKNEKKLPINVRELIGNYIKNQDIIIVSLIHHSSDVIEENSENEEESEYVEQDEKKILCPKEKLPILKRKGYNMIPNESVIARMSIDEIKNVNHFAIYNENGKIEFDETVSIFGVNFDKLFNIEHDLIEYEKGEWCHSPRGSNFNIPATITLYNIHSRINLSNNNEKKLYLEFLKNKCQKNLNGTFLSYNFETHELKYKIPYFY